MNFDSDKIFGVTGFNPRKRFGQNFLIDHRVIRMIIDSMNLKLDDKIVEIGPGFGALTKPILELVDSLHVVELDRNLVKYLVTEYDGKHGKQLIIHSFDALKFNFNCLGSDIRIIGNLPYNISTQILFHFINQINTIRDITVMLQKEVVERILAAPGHSHRSRASVILQRYFHLKLVLTVEARCFYPMPKVNSAVLHMIPKKNRNQFSVNEALLWKVVNTAFSQKRKMIGNALKLLITDLEIQAAGIDPRKRAEDLNETDFIALTNQITLLSN